MIKSVLVYVDGSSSSKAATLAAIKIAREQKANLVGMAIVHEPGVHAGRSTSISGSSFEYIRDMSQLVDASTRAAGWLATFESHCRSAGVPVEVLKIVGRPAESLLAEIERHDLTLIGSEADFQFETARDIRSTREKILRRASRPVLLVPNGATGASGPLGPRVLVAYDGGRVAQRALASFAISGLAQSREVHIATVGDDGAKVRGALERGFADYLDASAPARKKAAKQNSIRTMVMKAATPLAVRAARQAFDEFVAPAKSTQAPGAPGGPSKPAASKPAATAKPTPKK